MLNIKINGAEIECTEGTAHLFHNFLTYLDACQYYNKQIIVGIGCSHINLPATLDDSFTFKRTDEIYDTYVDSDIWNTGKRYREARSYLPQEWFKGFDVYAFDQRYRWHDTFEWTHWSSLVYKDPDKMLREYFRRYLKVFNHFYNTFRDGEYYNTSDSPVEVCEKDKKSLKKIIDDIPHIRTIEFIDEESHQEYIRIKDARVQEYKRILKQLREERKVTQKR